MTANKPRYIVAAHDKPPTIACKLYVFKTFGVYPKDDEYELVTHKAVPAHKVFVLDRQKIEAQIEDAIAALCEGGLDSLYLAVPRLLP